MKDLAKDLFLKMLKNNRQQGQTGRSVNGRR